MNNIEIIIEGSTATLTVDGTEIKGVSEFSIQKSGHAPVEILIKGIVTKSIQVCS